MRKEELIKSYNSQTLRIERLLLTLTLLELVGENEELNLVVQRMVNNLTETVNLSMNGVGLKDLQPFVSNGELDGNGLNEFLVSLKPYCGYLS